jgi:hypothetical protein
MPIKIVSILTFLTNSFGLKEYFGYMNANQNRQYFRRMKSLKVFSGGVTKKRFVYFKNDW